MSTAEKFKETVKYICQVSEKDDLFSKVKLCKLLYRIDAQAYLKYGKTITGQEYRKLPQGPVPPAVFPVLESTDDFVILVRDYYGYKQHKPVNRSTADISGFSGEEIALINAEVQRCWRRSATDLSNESHTELGWLLVEDNEVIPIQAALLDNRPLTQSEVDYANKIDLSKYVAAS